MLNLVLEDDHHQGEGSSLMDGVVMTNGYSVDQPNQIEQTFDLSTQDESILEFDTEVTRHRVRSLTEMIGSYDVTKDASAFMPPPESDDEDAEQITIELKKEQETSKKMPAKPEN